MSRAAVPVNAIKMPYNCFLKNVLLKIVTPTSKVNNGVNEFKIPAMLLSTCVCADAKRNAGMALPTKPTMARKGKSAFLTLRSAGNEKGKKKSAAMPMRHAATCAGLSIDSPVWLRSPFFIRMKELPQINESAMNAKTCVIF